MAQQPGFSEFQAYPGNLQWRSDRLGDLPKEVVHADVALSGIEGAVTCIIPSEHIDLLFEWLIGDRALAEVALRESFLRYFFLQALEVVGSINPLNKFTPSLVSIGDQKQFEGSDEEELCIDLSVKRQEQTLVFRLVFQNNFVESWKAHWQNQSATPLADLITRDIELTLQLTAGQTALTLEEMKNLNVGDWVKLDSHGFDQDLKPSQLSLRVKDSPIGKSVVEQEGAKITEFNSPLASFSKNQSTSN